MAEYIVDTTNGVLDARTTGKIVRCRDCKHCVTDGEGRYVCASHRCTTTPDGYCAWGEKIESPSARMVELGHEVCDAYVRECERMGIDGTGMGKYKCFSDNEDGKSRGGCCDDEDD